MPGAALISSDGNMTPDKPFFKRLQEFYHAHADSIEAFDIDAAARFMDPIPYLPNIHQDCDCTICAPVERLDAYLELLQN